MSKKIKTNAAAAPPLESHLATSRWAGLGRGERIAVVAVCLLLVVGSLGAGLSNRITSIFSSTNTDQRTSRSVQNKGSGLSSLNSLAAPPPLLPSGTPQLSKEYIYAASRLLTVEDANAAPQTSGYEGDVQNRPDGDEYIDADDVQQIRNFVVGVDLPYQANEAQRADCSPRSTLGDGYVDSDDVQQARRYSVGTDTQQRTGGSLTVSTLLFDDWQQPSKSAFLSADWTRPSESAPTPLLSTVVRIQTMTGSTGTRLVVPVRVDASGGEAVFGFSLSYDAAKLSNPVVTIGTAGGDVITNITPTSPNANPIGFSVTNFSGGTLRAGVNQLLLNVQFDVAPNISAGTTALTLNDLPGSRIAKRKVVGVDPLVPLPQTNFTNGVVTILRQVVTDAN